MEEKLNCPKCLNYKMEKIQKGKIIIDKCPYCHGYWFDANEIDYTIDLENKKFKRKGLTILNLGDFLGNSKWLCPRCNRKFDIYDMHKETNIPIEVCGKCSGIFLERKYFEEVISLPKIENTREYIEDDKSLKTWLFNVISGLPYEFNVKPDKFPIVTLSLIILNVFIFFVSIASGKYEIIVRNWALTYNDIFSFHGFITLFTSQFLHGGIFHLFSNMYFLYILGDNIEEIFGRYNFLAFYLICGVFSGFVQALASHGEMYYGLGASGAISGVMAAYVIFFRNAKLSMMLYFYQIKFKAYIWILIWIGNNLLGIILKTKGVGWYSHLSGLGIGIIISFFFYEKVIQKSPYLKYLK